MGLPPRHAIPSLPSVRLPFERLAATVRRLPLDRVGTGIGRLRLSELRESLRRSDRPEPTPGLGPINFDRDLAGADLAAGRIGTAVGQLRIVAAAGYAGASKGLARIPVGRNADGTARLGDVAGQLPSSRIATAAGRVGARLSDAAGRVSAGLSDAAGRLSAGRVGAAAERLPLDRLGGLGRIDGRVLAILGVLLFAGFYGLFFANPATQQESVAAAEVSERPATPAVQTPDPSVLTDPFGQGTINDHLRALRKTVGPGDQARNLLLLGDGTMGTTIVSQAGAENLMVRGTDLAAEPLATDVTSGAALDLKQVRGISITRVLERAETAYRLPTKQLASLRLVEHPKKAGTFMWTGVWNDAARTTLYADQAGTVLAPKPPR